MNKQDNYIFYLISYPFIWVYDQIEYVFYYYLYPLWTGMSVADGWNPKFVKNKLNLLWKPSSPIDIPYFEFMNMHNEDLRKYGFEKTKSGNLRRIASPQMYYANPNESSKWGDVAWKCHLKNLEDNFNDYKKSLILDPLSSNLYNDKITLFGHEIISYNIQSKVYLFSAYSIDIIDLLCSCIFLLLFLLVYFIFYHVDKLNMKAKRLEHYLITGMNEEDYDFDEYELEQMKKDERKKVERKKEFALLKLREHSENISACEMNDSWREASMISSRFYVGIEVNYCFYEGSLISFELALIMLFYLILTKVYNFLYYYLYLFYIVNIEFFTYVFVYLFGFLALFFWFKLKRDKKKATHRCVERDYYFSHWLNHFFKILFWLNLYKLVYNVDIFVYVLIYVLTMLWIYFGCDSVDYFMGWDQDYRVDIYYRQTNMHFWWPRVLMNQTWHHFYITLMKPIHFLIINLMLWIILPLILVFMKIVYYQNKLHVYINNKFFFWNAKKYTIDEIKQQWKKDRVINYVKEQDEKNRKVRTFTIL